MKLVKYVQENCTPCKMVEGFLNHIDATVDETVVLNSDEARDKVKELKVMSTPTMILFDDNGEEIDRVAGVGQGKIQKLVEMRG